MSSHKGPGDPQGKKLARRQAEVMEEGCRLAECLSMLLRRAGLDDTNSKAIAQDLRIRSVQLTERAQGRVEARLTTRTTGHPLLENRPVTCLFLDESGTSALAAHDQVFALGGLAMHEEDVPDYVKRANDLKLEFFGRLEVTFHEPTMRKHNDDFSFGGDPKRREEFDDAFRKLVEDTKFVAFGVGIRKAQFKDQFIETNIDPYLPKNVYDLAIMLMLERFVDYLATNTERRLGRVHLESIGSLEDAKHQSSYADLLVHGTQFVSDGSFQSWVEAGCRFSPKQGSNPAELADLIAREVFEWTRSNCTVRPPYWDVLNSKCYLRGDGCYGKFGFKVFPSHDILADVLAHRVECGGVVLEGV